MVWKYQRVGHHNILPPARRENHNLGNILGRQRLHTLIHLLSLLLVASKPHNTELCFHLTWVNLDDSDSCSDEFFAHGVGKGAHGGFGSAVNGSALIGFATRNRTDVYNVAATAGFEYGQDGLCHSDKTGHVGREHGVDVGGGDVRCLGDTFYKATVMGQVVLSSGRGRSKGDSRVVDEDIDFLEVCRQLAYEALDLVYFADIKLDREHLDAFRETFNLLCNFLQCVFSTRS
jgi:hypothetical protein